MLRVALEPACGRQGALEILLQREDFGLIKRDTTWFPALISQPDSDPGDSRSSRPPTRSASGEGSRTRITVARGLQKGQPRGGPISMPTDGSPTSANRESRG